MRRAPTDDRELRERLRALRVDPAAGDFQAALHRRLAAAGPPRDVSPWARLAAALAPARRLAWPLAGAAAGLAVFLAAPRLLPRPGPGTGGLATLLPATKVALVRLDLTADVAVEGAEVRVTLPAGLAFWADGRELPQRSLEWTQPLGAGRNEIPIAVRGQRPGSYRIAVSARIGEQVVEDEVLLEVVEG